MKIEIDYLRLLGERLGVGVVDDVHCSLDGLEVQVNPGLQLVCVLNTRQMKKVINIMIQSSRK